MKQRDKVMNPIMRTLVLMSCVTLFLMIGYPLHAQTIIPNPSFAVKKTGTGRPMILIPGLFCSGNVWDETVEHFKDRYTCYEITLPGFAGQPPVKSDSLLKTIVSQLADFIRQNKLKKPIIVGHSLGGSVALQFAVSFPELPGDLIIVSSAPFLPGLAMSADVTVDSSAKIGLQIKNGMKDMTTAQIEQSQNYALPTMIKDSAKIAFVRSMAVKSDSYTQAEVMYELFSTDLRNEMKNIQCPVLVMGDWFSYRKYGATRESVLKNYTDQFSLAKNVTIAINDSSNHFIMYDEPQWFYHQIESFLGDQ